MFIVVWFYKFNFDVLNILCDAKNKLPDKKKNKVEKI